mmetsp:Transcript_2710/g.10845  ORF Transcript_2710/g.10845 Transcript_2710/m.10845 type:complete len:207 (-) Transcript_2710:3844-4464(-)
MIISTSLAPSPIASVVTARSAERPPWGPYLMSRTTAFLCAGLQRQHTTDSALSITRRARARICCCCVSSGVPFSPVRAAKTGSSSTSASGWEVAVERPRVRSGSSPCSWSRTTAASHASTSSASSEAGGRIIAVPKRCTPSALPQPRALSASSSSLSLVSSTRRCSSVSSCTAKPMLTAVALLSPVSMYTLMPASRRAATASGTPA